MKGFCYLRIFLSLLPVFMIPVATIAQLTIVPGSATNMTPLEFVQAYLVGEGVTVTNALFNGSPDPLDVIRDPSNTADQIGSFTALAGAATELGLDGGIILSTGKAQDASKAVLPSGNASFATNSGGDDDLEILAGVTTYDKSILEFDLVPLTDVISFRYVFASEEFDEYCNQYNDSFGFFISGPGITPGPFSNAAQNIALLPATTLTVTINNICAYDQGVPNGLYSWWNGNSGSYYTYDRFTYVYTASITVQCGQTYHLKMAIGDAGDRSVDSGIFLEQNSLTSDNFADMPAFSNPLTGNYLVEGCSDVTMVYEIPYVQPVPFVISLDIDPSSTATAADITPSAFPIILTIPAGSLQSPAITITPVPDGLPEPTETLVMKATTTVCSSTNSVLTSFFLNDFRPLSVSDETTTVCNGSPVTLVTNASGGQPVMPQNSLVYHWSTGATTESITLTPPSGLDFYTVTVTDACSQAAVKHFTVNVSTIPVAPQAITGPSLVCIPAINQAYSVPAVPDADTYVWTLPAGTSISSGNNTNAITVDFSLSAVSGNISVKGRNTLCGDGPETSLAVAIHTAPEAAGAISGPATLCSPAIGQLYSVPAITGAETYVWTLPPGASITSGNNTGTITVDFSVSAVSGNITVKGTNSFCGDGPSSSLPVVIHPSAEAAGAITGSATVCQGATGVVYSVPPIGNATGYDWIVPPGATITSGSNTSAITCAFSLSAASGNVTVRGYNADCGFGASSSLPVTVNPFPADAGPISGPAFICSPAAGQVYSVSAIAGADSYQWTLPTGASVTAGNNTNAITVDFSVSAVSGNITVRGANPLCGAGSPSSLPVVIHPSAAAAGVITGAGAVCQGTSGVVYTVPTISNATGYDWTVPSGVTITSGNNTNTIICAFGLSAISGSVTVRGYNADCGYGAASAFPVTVNPLPADAGAITGPTGASVCQGQSAVAYSIPSIAFATGYNWSYTGTGATLAVSGPDLLVDFSLTATSGVLTVTGNNACGNGVTSVPYAITVKPKPEVDFTMCNPTTTTKNGRPVVLKGGRPYGAGGVYSGTGVSLAAPGEYVFDPASGSVAGGSATVPNNYTVTYKYTNIQGCSDQRTATISVYKSNAGDACPGTLTDHRDGMIYETFLDGTGPGARCWMAENLNYGTFAPQTTVQSDNCTADKYCLNDQAAQCNLYGGLYQWGEIMEYLDAAGFQDICPGGWHVATSVEWDLLISDLGGEGLAAASLKDPFVASGFHGLVTGISYQNNLWAFTSGNTIVSMFWTSDALTGGNALARGMNSVNPSVSRYPSSRDNAFPVRCVRN